MSVLTTDGWQTQWRRIERGFKRLSEVYNDTELYDDAIYHFFQDAWHLKDWIKNDPCVPQGVRDRVEKEVSQVRVLRIAADLANATKHMVLGRPRQENAQLTERKVTVFPTLYGPARPPLQQRTLTLADGSTTTAEEVAAEIMQEWELLLRTFGLKT